MQSSLAGHARSLNGLFPLVLLPCCRRSTPLCRSAVRDAVLPACLVILFSFLCVLVLDEVRIHLHPPPHSSP